MEMLDILKELGYDIRQVGRNYTTQARYRGGKDSGSLTLYPSTNSYYDWVMGEGGDIKKLIRLTLNLDTEDKVELWLKDKNLVLTKVQHSRPKIKTSKVFPSELLKKLAKDHSFWKRRGIIEETLHPFQCGVAIGRGQLANRYVFPIFNNKGAIIGFSARALNQDQKDYKWICLGGKTEWAFPLILNHDDIRKSKRVIITEGIGDVISLFEVGIRDCACTFGTTLLPGLLKAILKLEVEQIIIATNYDEPNDKGEQPGVKAAKEMSESLHKYYDEHQIETRLPKRKDINDMLTKDGKDSVIELYG
jgi:5S rRNA maturation endonuclease (ribonuclease M5)